MIDCKNKSATIKGLPNYTIIRSQRHTVAIHITPEGKVEVRAPFQVSERLLEKIVVGKAKWITTHLTLWQEQQHTLSLEEGAQLPFLGQWLPIIQGEGPPILTSHGFLLSTHIDTAQKKAEIVFLYRQAAYQYISPLVKDWSLRTNLQYKGLRITSAKTRWGSCSGRNTLSFSWRLMAAPPQAVEYVVIHELVHTRYHNHSHLFWELVAQYCPHWKEQKSQLTKLAEITRLL